MNPITADEMAFILTRVMELMAEPLYQIFSVLVAILLAVLVLVVVAVAKLVGGIVR